MSIKTKPFDAARYIDDTQTQAELLNEVLATGDRRALIHVVGTIARARGMTELARITGINRTTLYAAIGDDANPTMDTFLAIVDGLNLQVAIQAKEPEAA